MSRRPHGRRRGRREEGTSPPGRDGGGTTPRSWSLALALIALAIYLLQCPTASGDKDSPELVIVLALNGAAHPTGYPLYTVLGHLFVRLLHALGTTWAYAANAWSAVGGATAIYLLHRLALELASPSAPEPANVVAASRRGRFLLASVPVALLAFDPIWTYETTLAEVYSWHVAWVLGAALYFARLVRELAAETPPTARRLYRHAALWGLLCGVGGAHHATSILVAAPLTLTILAVLVARRRMRAGLVPTVIAGASVPLLAYGFLLWRTVHPTPIDWWGLEPGLGSLWVHMTGRQFGALLGHFNPAPEQSRFLRVYVYPLFFPGLLLASLAAIRARTTTERARSWGLAASALGGTAHAFGYGAVDPASYFLYPMALGLAAATPFVGRLAAAWRARATRAEGGSGMRGHFALAATSVLLAAVALALWLPWLRTGRDRARTFVAFDRYVHSMWQAIPMDSAIVFWNADLYYKLKVYQLLDGEKPGVLVVHARGLYMPGGRARFAARIGFDPLDDPEVAPYASLRAYAPDSVLRGSIAAMEGSVNRRTRLPVIDFDPELGTVRLLRKPGAEPGLPAPQP